MKCSSFLASGGVIMLFTFVSHLARADKIVVAFSSATPGYQESRMKDGKLQPQTYVIMRGQFYSGTTRDRSLEKTPFSTVVNRLAIDLKEQAFYPARSLKEADLLLIVHWGVTIGRGNDYELDNRDLDHGRQLVVQYNSAIQQQSQPDGIGNGVGMISTGVRDEIQYENLQNSTSALNADVQQMPASMMLGFSADLRNEQAKMIDSERQHTLVSLLQADRYFVVVFAYDFSTLLREKKLKRLWSCRLSIRSPGVNFPIALDRMGQVGGNFFGTEQTELKMVPAKKKRAEVTIGEAIVIDYDVK